MASVTSAPGLTASELYTGSRAADARPPKVSGGISNDKARATAQDFESVFLNTMVQQMFTATEGDGPLGGSGSAGVWRSLLGEEYARNFAKAGGIGLAEPIYRSLLSNQEVRSAGP